VWGGGASNEGKGARTARGGPTTRGGKVEGEEEIVTGGG